MAEQRIKEIQCKHCPHTFEWTLPNTPGLFSATCPYCGGNNSIKLVHKSIKKQTSSSMDEQPVHQNDFVTAICPECKKKLVFIPAKKDASYKLQCSECKSDIHVKLEDGKIISIVKMKTKPLIEGNRSNGKLTELRFTGLFSRLGCKSHPLHVGHNTVGRYDDTIHSDIEIKGDETMSRRSINIEVIQKENGFFFKLTVLKATWPVMHNDKPLVEGEAIYLNYGDNIKLGQTTFIFNRASS